jgi:predicted enzyme involved in methoxymalonyl-ACP biosynthesis
MNIAAEAARQRGVRAIIADYIATSKNDVISSLYPSLGFSELDNAGSNTGAQRWFLNLENYVMRDTHIASAGAAG